VSHPPFNIRADDIGEYARRVLADKGIDPAGLLTEDNSVAEHLSELYRHKLETLTPALFRDKRPTIEAVTGWMRRFAAGPAGTPNLLLQGPTGSGKSHNGYAALWGIALHYARAGRRLEFAKTTHADFNQAMRPTSDGSHLDALAGYQGAGLLMFDDLGAGQLTDWSTDTLHRLVDARWAGQRPMIVTTNLTAAELRDILNERIVSRLLHSTQVALEDVDHRRDVP
jgi:DNA replication protein DnaC